MPQLRRHHLGTGMSIKTAADPDVAGDGLARRTRRIQRKHRTLYALVVTPLAASTGWLIGSLKQHIELLSGEVTYGHPDHRMWQGSLDAAVACPGTSTALGGTFRAL